jgi:hypothetical protein
MEFNIYFIRTGSLSDYQNYEHKTMFFPLLMIFKLFTKSRYKMKYTLGLLIFWTLSSVHIVYTQHFGN